MLAFITRLANLSWKTKGRISFWSSLFGGNAQERHVEREIQTQIVQDLIDGGMSTGDAVSVAKEEIEDE